MPGLRLDLDRFLRIPRLADLDVSLDGRWIVYAAGRPAADGKRYVRDLHRVPLHAKGPAEQLTRGETNDGSPRCMADGSVLFLSDRPDPARKAGAAADAPDAPTTQLWRLPPAGEALCLTQRPASLSAFARAARASDVVFRAAVHPDAPDAESDRRSADERRDSGRSGQVFDALPIRFWDRFYGPRYEHLFHVTLGDSPGGALALARDLTPGATLAYDDLGFDVSPDGCHAVASERQQDEEGRFFENLRLFDLRGGGSRPLTTGRDSYTAPRFAPDASRVVAVFHENIPGRTGRQWLVEVPVAAEAAAGPRRLAPSLDLWPDLPVYSADGRAVFFLADEQGHHPVFRVALDGDTVARLTARGSHGDLAVSPDGSALVAVASALDAAPEIVALDPARSTSAQPRTRVGASVLEGVDLFPPVELVATAKDGRQVRSWLVRPAGEPPPRGFPLLLWIHGGPLGSFGDGWHWRWNPQLFAARGYAVLLVNPRISTGYGQEFIEEGFARWGGEPYDDLMAALDAAAGMPGLDASRTAAMGGSYGGYMANWIAGRTARFRCIVSHAGLWQLTGFHGTTDLGAEWEREFGGDPYRHPETYERWSPHRAVCDIRTPMLVIHGEKDYRVPVSEAFQLFTALQRLGVPSRLLYFPDENHWILRPPNIRTWHETIWDWLDRWLAEASAPPR